MTASHGQGSAAESSPDSIPTRHLVLFFVLAFGWSWLLWGPKVLAAQGVIAGWPDLPEVAAFGPTIAGIVMVYASRGRMGVHRLVERTVTVGFPSRWVVVALALFPMLAGTTLLLATTQGVTPTAPWDDDLVVLPGAFVYILLLGGPLQEEYGWRGYALDPLQTRFGAAGGSVVLGVLWSLWHLPLYYFPTETIVYDKPFWGLLVSVTMLSVLMTWVYNNTGGSLLAMLLMHASFNWSQAMFLFPVLDRDVVSLIFFGVAAVVTVTVVLVWGPRDLVRDAAHPGVDTDDHEIPSTETRSREP